MVFWQIKKIEDYYQNTESKSSVEEKIRSLELALTNNQGEVEMVRKFFVQKGDEISFIEQLEKLGNQVGLKFEITSIDVKPNQAKNLKEDVTVRVGVDGSWENIMKFVDGLEKMSFGVMVQDLNIDTKSETGWSGFLEFVVFREI
jgi:Tfp pilus assembly protein PilO